MVGRGWFSHTVGSFVASCAILGLSFFFWKQIRNGAPSHALGTDLELALLITAASQTLLWVATKVLQRKAYKIAFHLILLAISVDAFLMQPTPSPTHPQWLQDIGKVISSDWQRTRLMFLVVPAMVLWLLFLDYLFIHGEKGDDEAIPVLD